MALLKTNPMPKETPMTADTAHNPATPDTAFDPSDLLDLAGLLTDEELALRAKVRTFVDERIRPNIAEWYEGAIFPTEIVREMG